MALRMEHNPLVLYIAYKYDLDQNELNGAKPRLICIKRKLILELDALLNKNALCKWNLLLFDKNLDEMLRLAVSLNEHESWFHHFE